MKLLGGNLGRFGVAALLCLVLTGTETTVEDNVMSVEREALKIKRAGLIALTDASQRDAVTMQLAQRLGELASVDKARLEALETSFQGALLPLCGQGLLDTLAPATVEAVDNALESVFSLEDIARSNQWEPLIYVYGFFNHDVTVPEITMIADRWNAMSEEERRPAYPPYIHAIDAVCKPLSMAGLRTDQETTDALNIAVPLLKSMLLQRPIPGRAFHPPSHAALVLFPLYQRWASSESQGALLQKHLGTREEFIALACGQLVGSRADRNALEKFEYGFYAYSGRYIANALARFDARSAVPTLRASLQVYEAQNSDKRTIAYTRRALLALGDPDQRAALSQNPEDTLKTIRWLCQNAQGESRDFANRLLAAQLQCAPAHALTTYYASELKKLTVE
jgi:hypothetical protein